MMEGLKDIGIVKGSVDDMMEENIFALFFPHGLGHFLGLDTHDVGGYPKGVDRIDRPGIKFLRARRELLPGMVITIEPGIYFVPAVLKPAMADPEKNKFLNTEKVESLLGFGGVRIEDDIIVTEDGMENMTNVPKEVDEIEDLMKG
jgi:Xaa-Pro dipeptidase